MGDPVIPVGQGWIVVQWYGDFRLTRDQAVQVVGASVRASQQNPQEGAAR